MMIRHPELQPYTPSDRYGIIAPAKVNANGRRTPIKRNSDAIARQHRTKQATLDNRPALLAGRADEKARTELMKDGHQTITKVGNTEATLKSFTKPTRPIVRTSQMLNGQVNQKTPTRNTASKVGSLQTCRARSKPSVCQSIPANRPELPSKIAKFVRQSDVATSPPEDSGAELESSSMDVSSSSSNNSEDNCQDQLNRNNFQDQVKEPLQRTKEHFDAMARKEEEDRRSRMQIVENILSRLNIANSSE